MAGVKLANGSEVVLNLVGDVQPHRKEPETLFRHVESLLADGDINLCQLECTISDKGVLAREVRNPAHRVPPENIRALTAAPFHGITFAGNNNLDYGLDAFDDTINRVKAAGMFVVGAGENLAEASRAVIRDVRGIKVAFIDNCSILPYGYAATNDMPGIAPLPVETFYAPLEKLNEQPGTPARTVTIADGPRLESILQEISRARAEADFVVACFHWGVHFTHDLATYQAEVAYAAVDAGADVVVGTHPHCLQAIDTYRGKPIFYSLGNFAFEQPGEVAMKGASSYLRLYGIPADTSVPGHPHPRHCRPSVVVKMTVTGSGEMSFKLVPTYLNDSCEPELAAPGSPEYEQVRDLLVNLSSAIGTTIIEDDGILRVKDLEAVTPDTREILRDRNMSYPSLRYLATDVV